MKTLKIIITAILLILANVSAKSQAVQCTSDIYFERTPFYDNLMLIGVDTNKSIIIEACCLNMGPDNFVIACNDTTGVHPDPVTGEMVVPHYFEFVLKKAWCGEEVASYYKEDFYFSSSDELYQSKNGQITLNPVFAQEWPFITQYGVPDTNIYGHPYVAYDPTQDCKTNIVQGYNDCYYNTFHIGNVPDGYYDLMVCIDMPATINDPGVYPSGILTPVFIQGMNISYNVQPPAQTPVHSISNLQNPSNRTFTWDADQNACYYEVYVKLVKGNKEQDTPYAPELHPIKLTTNSFYDSYAVKNQFYRWSFRAVNSAGQGNLSSTGQKIQVK